jgi:hypothetical protein
LRRFQRQFIFHEPLYLYSDFKSTRQILPSCSARIHYCFHLLARLVRANCIADAY